MIISQEQTEIKAAYGLVQRSELKRVRLRQCRSSIGGDGTLKGPFSLLESHQSIASSTLGRVLRVEVSFHFQSVEDSEERSLVFEVECSFDLDYQLDEGYQPPPEAIEAFKKGNAIFNCWPYAREFLQNITSRMGLAPPPLPLLRIVPKRPKGKTKHKLSAPAARVAVTASKREEPEIPVNETQSSERVR